MSTTNTSTRTGVDKSSLGRLRGPHWAPTISKFQYIGNYTAYINTDTMYLINLINCLLGAGMNIAGIGNDSSRRVHSQIERRKIPQRIRNSKFII